MHITQISVKNLKSFKNVSTVLNPSKNINIIIGKNGSGKSNLMTAIATFFSPIRITTDDKQNLINEGNVISQKLAQILLQVARNDRFPFKENFTLRRSFDMKRDDYVLLGANDETLQLMNRDEMRGIFESVNLSDNTLFIIQQGKINQLSMLDDLERYELIKNIAGASVYERDRKQSEELLIESEKSEERIGSIMKSLEERIGHLDKEKKRLLEWEDLEKKKREIEVAIFVKEKKEVEDELRKYEIQDEIENSDSDDFDNLQDEIRKIENEIKNERNEIKLNDEEFKMEVLKIKENNDDINLKNTNKNQKYIVDTNQINCTENNNKENIDCNYNNKNAENFFKENFINVNQNEKELQKNKMNGYIASKVDYMSKKENNLKKLKNLNHAKSKNIVELNALKYEKEFLISLKARGEIPEQEAENTLKEINEKRKEINETLEEKSNEPLDYFAELEKMIENRNKLWNEEKKNETIRKSVIEEYKQLEKKLFFVGGSQFSTYQEIKNLPGVHGCVFELISIPEDLIPALESTALNSLFNIVVDDDLIVSELIKIIKGRVTFIPLNRINKRNNNTNNNECENNGNDKVKTNERLDSNNVNKNLKEIENAILLSSQIKCKDVYKPILEYVTKSSYLVSDVKTGVIISRTHNVNVVTIEGDFISKKGSISSGSESKESFLSNLKKKEIELRKIEKNKNTLKKEIVIIEEKIKNLKIKKDIKNQSNDKDYIDAIKSIIVFLERKYQTIIKIKEGKSTIKKELQNINKISEKINELEIKDININKELKVYEIEINELENKIKNINLNIEEINEKLIELEKIKCIERKKEELKKLKEKILLYNNKENKRAFKKVNLKDFDLEQIKMKKQILLEKRFNLIKKIGNIGVEILNDLDYNSLFKQVKEINEKLKKHVGINKKACFQYEEFVEKKLKLMERNTELLEGKKRINEFIRELDIKKEDAINLTFSMVKDNFRYFYSKLSPGNEGRLILNENKLLIKINDEVFTDLKKLSGGQKTILALTLIFSIQKIDPSPFYFFDEIDANLDKQSRIRVGEVIRELSELEENNTQFFITTFREEMTEIGNKFYCVEYENKSSNIKEINKEIALDFVCEVKNIENN
ncbi:hypothetical protein COBT_001046 [Conglomerata obtusa]